MYIFDEYKLSHSLLKINSTLKIDHLDNIPQHEVFFCRRCSYGVDITQDLNQRFSTRMFILIELIICSNTCCTYMFTIP